MKAPTRICSLLMLLSALICTSCDSYFSNVPISLSDERWIHNELSGNWILVEDKSPYSHPILEVRLSQLDEKEYIATVLYKKSQDRGILEVETYRVHNSLVDGKTYLNLSQLGGDLVQYAFIQLEDVREDSVVITFITDSLETKFKSSAEFKAFLQIAQKSGDTSFFSQRYTYIRPQALTWEKVNKEVPISSFSRFFSINKMDEDRFRDLTDEEIKTIVGVSDTLTLERVKANFGQLYYAKGKGIFKRPRYGVVELNSGRYIKVKYEEGMSTLQDLSSEITYLSNRM
ncbi:MAG: hypothetical protein AAFP77_02785 [Bacteroidota bacterium]